MPVEIALWRVGETLEPLAPAKFSAEARLEQLIASDPGALGMDLLILGRQENAFGKRIDLLAIDSEGRLAILELKRDKTPRDVVAQILEYGGWVATLDLRRIEEIYAAHHPEAPELSRAFSERFGAPLPDAISAEEHQLIIVCSELDASTERIVTYLSTRGVPINAVFFRTFRDAGGEFIACTWFIEPQEAEVHASRSTAQREPWNGTDYYVAFGEGEHRDWEDARQYGFVSAGQGAWYSRTLKFLEPGARVFVCIPGTGYVGVGTVTEGVKPVKAFEVEHGGRRVPILEVPLRARSMGENAEDPSRSEYLVRVEWIKTEPVTAAIWEKGMFANQNSACRLRNRFTLDVLYRRFQLGEGAP